MNSAKPYGNNQQGLNKKSLTTKRVEICLDILSFEQKKICN
jgi:hypothetical protein